MKLILSAISNPASCYSIFAALTVAAASTIAAPAQTFTSLATFNGGNGSESEAPLVQVGSQLLWDDIPGGNLLR